MVLLELGSRLRSSLSGLSSVNPSQNEIAETVSAVCTALVEADVDVALVSTLKESVEEKIEQGEVRFVSHAAIKLRNSDSAPLS